MSWMPIGAVAAAVSVAGVAPAQSPLATHGRIESAGGTLRIGTAPTGTIKQVLVHEWDHIRAGICSSLSIACARRSVRP